VLACAAALTGPVSSLHAANVAPPGDLAAWSCVGQCGASVANGDIVLSPLANPACGFVSTPGSTAYGASPLVLDDNSRGIETNVSVIASGAFHAERGDLIDVHFN
jgi:hypothetical protein